MTPSSPEAHGRLTGYHQVLYWRLTSDRRALLIANGLGLALLILGLIGFLVIANLVRSNESVFIGGNFLLTLLALAAMVTLHELVHGLAMLPFGARPRFGVKLPGLAYATAPGYPFPRNGYLTVALAPLVLLSSLGIPLLAVVPASLTSPVILALALNVSGAIGDLMIVSIVLRYPSQARVIDEEDGMRIFLPEPQTTQISSFE